MSLIGKKILSFTSKSSRKQKKAEIPSYENAQQIGILYTYEGDKKEDAVKQIKTLLGTEKQTRILCFVNSKEDIEIKNPSFRIDQLNTWGKIESEEVNSFQEAEFDYLIHFDFESNEIIDSLLVNSKAKCRVGFHTEDAAKHYELMIGMNKSAGPSKFAEQIIKYLKAIK